jgi:hypothetical protein
MIAPGSTTKVVYHVTEGATVMHATDAVNTVRRHPTEWRDRPWSAEERAAYERERRAEQSVDVVGERFTLELTGLPPSETPAIRAAHVRRALAMAAQEIGSRDASGGAIYFPSERLNEEKRLVGRWRFETAEA